MMTRRLAWIGLLPLAALATGVHSGDSGSFSLDTGGQPSDARWVSAVSASFFLNTWSPDQSPTSHADSAAFSFMPLPAVRHLTGEVLDADTGLPLAGVELVLAPGGLAESSGANGHFRLQPVTQGSGYQLTASLAGYHSASVSGIEVEAHRPAFVPILLEPIRPPAVTGLEISANSDYYYLDWNAVPGVTQYRIRAAWDAHGYWSPVATTGQNSYSAPLPAGVEQTRLFRVSTVQ